MIKIRASFKEEKPTLFLVSTPIGNLGDITFRAIEVLKNVDLIYAEDTRITLKLLNHFNINKQVLSYHSFNEQEKAQEILNNLEKGLQVAFCSDAGTPGISDPGYYLVKEIKDSFPVVSVPGASAVLTGLISSGLAPQPFTFIGFTDKKSGKRLSMLKEYKKYPHTLVFYERGDRVPGLLDDMFKVFEKRNVVIAKELTKIYETFFEFELGTDISDINLKGEFVVMVSGYVYKEPTKEQIIKKAKEFIKKGYSQKDAISLTSEELNVNKNIVYEQIINANLEED